MNNHASLEEVCLKLYNCNKGETVRALYTVLYTLETSKPKKELPHNAGKPWTKEDDAELAQNFKEGVSRRERREKFARFFGSITSRLSKLGFTDV